MAFICGVEIPPSHVWAWSNPGSFLASVLHTEALYVPVAGRITDVARLSLSSDINRLCKSGKVSACLITEIGRKVELGKEIF